FLIVDNPLEPLPSFKGVAFRGSSGAGYHRVTPGDRDVRIFLSGTDLDVVTNVLVDTTINFVANQRYTIMHVGSARAGTDGIIVFEDELPTPEGSLSIRAFHAVE